MSRRPILSPRFGSNVVPLRVAPRARDPHIAIEVEAFGYGYDVRVLPPPVGIGHDRELRTIAEARAYAATLSKATGWPVVDNVGGDEAA